jgi:putative addiction module component (TIGR02574 family)
MPVALKKLEDEAMKLSPRSRARLAERLITSLEEPPDLNVERLWSSEAESRAAELSSGKVKGVPAGKVFKRARAALH